MITGLNGQPIRSGNALADTIAAMEPGATVSVTWETSDGVERSADLALISSPVN